MSSNFQDMHKINELSEELIKYLKRYSDYIGGEISYAGYDEINWRSEDYQRRGWDAESARDKAGRDYEEALQTEELFADWFALSAQITDAIKTLEKLTIKED